MNKILQQQLTKMDDVDFCLLEHHLWLARQIRETMKKRGLGERDMAAILKISPKQMAQAKNGSYPFDLRLMATLQAYNEQQAAGDAKYKIQAQSIEFANYKDQYPLIIERIEKLLSKIEKNQ